MSEREKIQSVTEGKVKLTCYESCYERRKHYQVHVHIDGIFKGPGITYHTNDKQDTLDYMNATLTQLSKVYNS